MGWQLCLVCAQTLDAVTNAILLVIQSSIELSFPMTKILNEAVQHKLRNNYIQNTRM